MKLVSVRQLLLASAALIACSVQAHAQGANNNCNGNGSCAQSTTNNNTTNNEGGEGGTGIGIGIGKGGNASASSSANSKNKNTNKQGQLQGQAQGQSIYWNDQREVHSASAPALAIGAEVCAQSQSIGGQTPAFGLSIGVTHDNESCERRKNAAVIFAMGYTDAARELMCQSEEVRAAMIAGGTPCGSDKPIITTLDGETLVMVAE